MILVFKAYLNKITNELSPGARNFSPWAFFYLKLQAII